MEKEIKPKLANVWGIFAATYAASWLIWLPAIVLRSEPPNLALIALGAFVPSVIAILFIFAITIDLLAVAIVAGWGARTLTGRHHLAAGGEISAA